MAIPQKSNIKMLNLSEITVIYWKRCVLKVSHLNFIEQWHATDLKQQSECANSETDLVRSRARAMLENSHRRLWNLSTLINIGQDDFLN